jgi:hypothetical protein
VALASKPHIDDKGLDTGGRRQEMTPSLPPLILQRFVKKAPNPLENVLALIALKRRHDSALAARVT